MGDNMGKVFGTYAAIVAAGFAVGVAKGHAAGTGTPARDTIDALVLATPLASALTTMHLNRQISGPAGEKFGYQPLVSVVQGTLTCAVGEVAGSICGYIIGRF